MDQRIVLPKKYNQWVSGRVVDLSTATEYYKRKWTIYSKVVAPHFKDAGGHRYELDPDIFTEFCFHLKHAHRSSRPCTVDGVNLVSSALCATAQSSAADELDEERAVAMAALYDGPLWFDVEPLNENPFNLYSEPSVARPISEAWKRLGNLSIPRIDSATFHEWSPGHFGLGIGSGDLIRLSARYTTDRNSLPKLTIEIEGEPVCLLMKAAHKHQQREFDQAKGLWDALLLRLSVNVGLGNRKRGRPGSDQGRRAAFLRDHCGWEWRQIARRLCESEHKHDRTCQSRARQNTLQKQAGRYWRELEQRVEAKASPA